MVVCNSCETTWFWRTESKSFNQHVITKFTHAQTCDHCVILYVLPLVFNKSMISSTISWSPSLENPDSYRSRETTFVSAGLPVLRLKKETELTCFHSEDLYCYCLYFNFWTWPQTCEVTEIWEKQVFIEGSYLGPTPKYGLRLGSHRDLRETSLHWRIFLETDAKIWPLTCEVTEIWEKQVVTVGS